MDLRKLKGLLGALREAGVTAYHDGELLLQLGAAPLEVPRGDVDVSADTSSSQPAPMALQDTVSRIRKAYADKPGRQ